MTEFKMKPTDSSSFQSELINSIADYLYHLPVGPRKYRDTRVRPQAATILRLVADILDANGYKIVEKENV